MRDQLAIFLVGIAISSGLSYSTYLYFLRESNLWWSNISYNEKLISFRTENALYYSYYNDFIKANNFLYGFRNLIWNNMTEYPNKINIIRRMNIWQEIFLGLCYRVIKYVKPIISSIDFYIVSVLLLQSITIASIFLLSSSLTKSIMGGFLSAVFCGVNRHNLSRVSYFPPLRENFALPFWWLHVLMLHYLIRTKKLSNKREKLIKIIYCFATLLFCIQWQLSPFIILIESIIMFVVDSLEFMPSSMTKFYYLTNLFGILGTLVLQMGNTMLLSSFSLAFTISSLIMGLFKSPKLMQSSFSGRLTWISIQATSRFIMALVIRILMQIILRQSDDSHIFRFLAAKFGIGSQRDLHVNLYLCSRSFDWLPVDNYLDSFTGVAYPYLIVNFSIGIVILISCLSVLWHDTEEEEELIPTIHQTVVGGEGDYCGGCGHLLSNRLELLYHYGMATSFLLLAMTVQRMQYLLTPYVIIFGTMFFCDYRIYEQITLLICQGTRMMLDHCFNDMGHNVTGDTIGSSNSSRTSSSNSDNSLSSVGPVIDGNDSDATVVTHGPNHLRLSEQVGAGEQWSSGYHYGTSSVKYTSKLNATTTNPYNVIVRFVETLRWCLVLCLITTLVSKTFSNIKMELSDLREFYDPETLELTNWIIKNTDPKSSFTGSMQLMATIKLVTGRPICNHPHYEDYNLRTKTRKLYQIYAKQTAEYVYLILKYYDVSHIIIEEGICHVQSNGCQLKDLIDLDNGHMPESPHFMNFHLRFTRTKRFCEQIRHIQFDNTTNFSNYFRFKFANNKFRIYEVL